MTCIRVGVVVEGHGEVDTVGLLLRRMADEVYDNSVYFEVPKPVRRPRSKLVRRSSGLLIFDDAEIKNAVELAAKNIRHDGAILFMIDADDDLACILAPELSRRIEHSHGHLNSAVVIPTIEFEAWYLAAAESLAGYNDLPNDVIAPERPESIRGAKGWLAQKMGRPYSPTVDQPKFATKFDLESARRAYSFDKFRREIDRIVLRHESTGTPGA